MLFATIDTNTATAQNNGARNRDGLRKPVHRVAQKPNEVSTNVQQPKRKNSE